MQRRVLAVVIAALVSLFAIVASAPAQPSSAINVYRVKATQAGKSRSWRRPAST